MDRDEAISALSSDEPKTRTIAIRALGKMADPSVVPHLEEALRTERVSFLRRLIPASIERVLSNNIRNDAAERPRENKSETSDGDYQKAVKFVTGVLLHEISPKIGLLRYSCQREIGDYPASETARTLTHLSDVLDGITSLREATVSMETTSFNADAFIREASQEIVDINQCFMHFDGPAGLEVVGDKALLRLSFTNGLRNAFEATKLSPSNEPIVIFWGQTDIEYYVTILDSGIGISGPQEAAFEIGKTNKRGHSGFGLAIARMAMTTLLGTVNLFPAKLGGMRFEMRWPKDG
ncbi:ATP-binding protein [Pacificibacter sp.]|uniref:ATP-binding protein n=1 Tax=Pacificibacter sp. TaxID=1917866 RepID=UPI00321B0A2C